MPSDDVVEFGGWPRPPKWVWAVAGIAVVAVLAGVIVARAGAHHTAASSPAPSPMGAASPTLAGPPWPSAAGACQSAVELPQIRLSRRPVHLHARLLIGGVGLREITIGGAVSAPLPGLPRYNRLVTNVVAGPGAAYAFDMPCVSSTAYARIYRIGAGGVDRLRVSADTLIGGPHNTWAVSYRSGGVLTRVLGPLAGSRVVRFRSSTDPIADTAAGLVAVPYRPLAGQRHAVELVSPNTGTVLRRIGDGFPMGAADHVLLVSLHGCTASPAPRSCTLKSFDLNTGRPITTIKLPPGRMPTGGDLSSPVFSPDGTLAAFQLARAGRDTRYAAAPLGPPSDVAVLSLRSGKLDVVPGLELPPGTWAGLAFDPTGRWLLATVSEGGHGDLLAWRPGMPGPALVTTLPGPFDEAPPLLPAPSWWH
jgi:hypothetical protein